MRALIALDARRPRDALRALRGRRRRRPPDPRHRLLLALVLQELGRVGRAVRVATPAPGDVLGTAARLELGALVASLQAMNGQAAAAARAAAIVLDLQPDHPAARLAAARAARALGDGEAALGHLQLLLRAHPRHAGACAELADLLDARGHAEGALRAWRLLHSIQPTAAVALREAGRLLARRGRLAESVGYLERACRSAPRDATARALLAETWLRLGDAARARARLAAPVEHPTLRLAALRVALATGDRLAAHEAVAGLAAHPAYAVDAIAAELELGAEPAVLLTRLESELRRNRFGPAARIEALFLHGRLLERLGRYDAAFAAFQTANASKRAFASSTGLAVPMALLDRYGERLLALPPAAATASAAVEDPFRRPVFVVGLPRSGSTVLEQALAAHPSVRALGELPYVGMLACERMGVARFAEGDPRRLQSLAPAVRLVARDRYAALAGLDARPGRAFTDKMPANLWHVPFIRELFPHARFVMTTRDPVETCLSCHVHNLDPSQAYATDLGELARYAEWCARLASHWCGLAPDRWLFVEHADVVRDAEAVFRRLCEFCELPWDSAMLQPAAAARPVLTFSRGQVRGAVAAPAVRRAEVYAAHLGPLAQLRRGPEPA